MTSPPSPTVRVTITVTPEVHATYKRMADAANMSLSRCMGEWLGDTIDAAAFMAEKMEQARAAPKIVMQEMHAYAQGLADETGALMETIREKGRQARSAKAAGSLSAPGALPPVGNTGGKGPSDAQGKHVSNPSRRASK